MKIIRFLAFGMCLLIFPLAAFAVDITIGMKGGVGFPFYSGSDYESALAGISTTKVRLGFSIGGFITIGIIDLLAIQPEVLYSNLGGNYGDDIDTWYDSATVIEIPVLVKVRLKLGNLIFGPFAGPDILIPIGDWSLEKRENATGTVLLSGTYIMDYFRVPIIGVVAGVGIDIPLGVGNVSVSIDGRFHLGIMNRFTDDNPAGLTDWKQNNIQILVGTGYKVLDRIMLK